MLGAILGLASAAAFGASNIFARGGVLRASSTYVANMSIFTGVPFFLFAAALTGDLFRLGQYSWQAYIFFALAGVVNFALGRTWAYRSAQLIGATRSNVATNLNFVVTVALAVIVLQEAIKPLTVVGILLSLLGPFVIVLKESTISLDIQSKGKPGVEVDRRTLWKGSLYGAGAAVFWGSSPILIKLGLDNGGSPVLGSLVAYLVACVVISPSSFLMAENRKAMLNRQEKALVPALLCGLSTNAAQLLRNLSLAYGLVIVVSLMTRTSPIWTLLFAFIFIREYESLSRWVLLGNGLLILGSLLVLVP